ncbi:NAD(P)-dependent alcohol dehydrogenase [Maricaulis sp.]|uniref:NAD(P)-dependent alcohol dehydrogenase n=1 Tax=Maricaulis sp. TaxID=1486257 RepID=UPI003A8E34C5
MPQSLGYAAQSADADLAPFSFDRREPGPDEVLIEITHCGVCHSDLHQARNDWKNTAYPCVPGHEIIGTVAAVGASVTRFKAGDTVGVGCLVDSCGTCAHCDEGLEQYCDTGATGTYNGRLPDGSHTYGGYSQKITVKESFVLRIPDTLDRAGAAPLLCAGITTYSPLRHWKVGPGQRVGVVGLGGLGHMAVKLAKAMGAEVVLFTTSPGKVEDAKRLGASEVVISKDREQMKAQRLSLDFILNTVAASHNLNPYLDCLKVNGSLVLVGVPEEAHPSPSVGRLLAKRRSIAGSAIGGIAETQEMLDFCAKHGIHSDIEMIAMADINEAYERMLKSDVKYRFVIDMATLT